MVAVCWRFFAASTALLSLLLTKFIRLLSGVEVTIHKFNTASSQLVNASSLLRLRYLLLWLPITDYYLQVLHRFAEVCQRFAAISPLPLFRLFLVAKCIFYRMFYLLILQINQTKKYENNNSLFYNNIVL